MIMDEEQLFGRENCQDKLGPKTHHACMKMLEVGLQVFEEG